MNKNENPFQGAKQLLHPIKNRPDNEPNREFVHELQNKLKREQSKKKLRLPLVPVFATASVLLIFTIFILSSNLWGESADQVENVYSISENSKLTLVDTFAYGSEDNQIGLYYEGMNETLPVTVSSFDVNRGTVYILDEARSQVVINNSDGETTSFPIQHNESITGSLKDILVTENGDIYILDSIEKLVYQYNSDGELKETFDLSKTDLFFPDSIIELENNEIAVSQRQEQFVSLTTLDLIASEEVPFHFEQVNRKEQTLQLRDDEKGISLFSSFGIGNRAVIDLTEEHVLYSQTVNPPIMESISETHLYALNREGEIVGGIRIPEESFMEKPELVQKYIKTDGSSIFLLIPEKEHVALYEVTLGKNYESFVEEQLEQVNIGFEIETFGEPFPELEEELNILFQNGLIEYGNKQSLNGVAIDENGTVVIDFKDFLAPSPASAQAQHLFEVLKSVTFEKFSNIKQIYFQFDGSFSAWCYWLESTEEPWKRTDALRDSLQGHLTEKTADVFKDMENLNWEGIATHVHEEKGLIFSFYANLGSYDSYEVKFTKSEVANLGEDTRSYIWGDGFDEKSFEYTPNDYVNSYLLKGYYSKEVLDYSVITYNEAAYVSGGIINTIHEHYPEAIYVDYFAPAPEGDDDKFHHWQALRFVYEEVEGEWYLIAIVRDVFNP
ncbi:hypothetical protein [Sutcliffiella sp. NC1]|uniref:hypothetical protein n=1 Tax=Sutcliffiella sp. NC1 TaxID=3004096 RepID=UPI0022DD69BB|nr:hypothetical protein [Sutcliffiella sp. NC1]WBL17094.1 hypothetical protein O1A01_10870 [Sutcliffiella sp. NC1]